MKNKIAIFVSVLLMTISFASCSDNNANTDQNTTTTTSVTVQEKPEEPKSETEKPDADKPEVDEKFESDDKSKVDEKPEVPEVKGPVEKPIKEIPMDDAYLGKILDLTDKPEVSPKADAADSDFVGKWECEVAVNGDTAYTGMLGIPLYVTDRIEIKDDNTGKIISTSGSKDGINTAEKEFSWKVSSGVLTAIIKGAAESTYPVEMRMSDDGRIMLNSKARDGADVSAYYKIVDEFTDFDFSSVHFDYDALAE